MSFPQLGYPQYLTASPAVYGGSDRPGVLAVAAAAAAAASGRSGGGGGGGGTGGSTELSGGSTAAVTSVLGMYAAAAAASPYGAPNYSAFLPYTADLSLFSQMGSQYELKDNPGVHPATFAAHTTPGYYPYGQFQYGDPGRPKNATRESTSTLKAWLNEHRKNPYPTKGEKIMLAIITKMTLTQVSTWFANARRRLKKENKVTWGARSKEDENIFGSDNEGDAEKNEDDEEIDLESIDIDKIDENDGEQSNEEEEEKVELLRQRSEEDHLEKKILPLSSPEGLKPKEVLSLGKEASDNPTRLLSPSRQNNLQGPLHNKPKIWSLAETATSPDGALSKPTPPSPPAQVNHTSPQLQHPAFLPSHGLYTCQIGKFHNWTNGAFLTQGSLLNVRSFLGVNHHHHAAHHNHHLATQQQQQQQQQQHPSVLTALSAEKPSERTSPKHIERENLPRTDSPPQQLKSPFQPVRDNSLTQQEGTS